MTSKEAELRKEDLKVLKGSSYCTKGVNHTVHDIMIDESNFEIIIVGENMNPKIDNNFSYFELNEFLKNSYPL